MKISLSVTLILVSLAGTILATSAQNPPVLDTSGQPLRRGVEYIIRPTASEVGGPFTLLTRNGSPCPPYVGQCNFTAGGILVTFTPFDKGSRVVRENRNFKVMFSASPTCGTSTAWKVDFEGETAGNRTLIATGDQDESGRSLANYFYISSEAGVYNMVWCPAELCPLCRLRCGPVGTVIENGQIFAALYNNVTALPLEFVKF